jgi:RHS repeat-associated protein
VHYIHERNSFVPLVQVRQARAIALSKTPDVKALMAANGGAYDIEQDPLWNGEQHPEPDGFTRDEIAFYQCDHLGTPHELTDHEGRVAWSAQYKAWGEAREAISEAGRRAGFVNPIRFQGQYFDSETGLHYNRHRYYDPASGRYVSRDPLGLAGGRNLHVYVGNNPVRGIDPLGLVDINLFPHDEAIRQSADNIPNPKGTFTVGGHGNPDVMVGALHDPITPKQMADRIKAHPSYTEGQHVVLMSCNTGNGTDPYAQKVANELGAPVSGPDKYLWIWPNGKVQPAGMKEDRSMDTSDIGKWRTFTPKP